MNCDPRFAAPEIPGWYYATNSSELTAEKAEREYRDAVTRIMARHGKTPGQFEVLVKGFIVLGDPDIRFAVYMR